MVKTVGILSLQGNYTNHKAMMDRLGTNNIYVRYPEDLSNCDGLIIPGGESTTISKQIDRNNLREAIIKFSETNSIFGTCAGLIMLSSSEQSKNLNPLTVMDITVERNAWGRQIHSFKGKLKLEFDNQSHFDGIFIRAPKIWNMGININVLATYKNQPVMITDGQHYVCSFHPEIGSDMRIHKYYLKQIDG